jgi:hypothetical protein
MTSAVAGGDWTGAGVSLAGLFDPMAAGPGTHDIIYTLGSGNCIEDDTISITVIDTPSDSLIPAGPFCENDALMLEINPLATVRQNGVEKVLVIDSKVSIDDNAGYRHKALGDIIDKSNLNPLELEAEKYNLSYIRLDGNIGCLVNGAGNLI